MNIYIEIKREFLWLFYLLNSMNFCWKLQTPNRHPWYNLSQCCGGKNMYLQFGSVPQIIFSHSWGQVVWQKMLIWSMQNDNSTINDDLWSILNYIFVDELGVYLSSVKTINIFQQVLATNRNPWHDLTQSCEGIKLICMIWIFPTDHFLTQPSTSLRIEKSDPINSNKKV